MARLNEPVVAPDGMEILRRKFLRQNRDIARINSTQSLRIRGLENECARMLSENLELRGQILRIETEIQESRAQRIADNAMEIKEKMEAQLLEWGSMLASLGHEPIPKNRSPRATKKFRRDPSMGLAGNGSPRFRRRNTAELEAAAIHEGRLAPLWENKPCPRETLNRNEILALCSEVTDADSPDLGPPPVSRFVDEEPVKIDLPTRTSSEDPDSSSVEESLSNPLDESSSKPITETMHQKETIATQSDTNVMKAPTNTVLEPSPPRAQVTSANLKRKIRDDEEKEKEKERPPTTRLGGDPVKGSKAQNEKSANRPVNNPIKGMPLVRKDGLEKSATLNLPTMARKPLGVKNANEVVQSPKKAAKKPLLDEIAKAKAEVKNHERARDKPKAKRREETLITAEILRPSPAPTPATITDSEHEHFSSEPNLSAPGSPELEIREEMLDTPPPVDISSKGETSRGGRRARSNVSYAEPSLRDKMRRPTKQLFDAVAGEGKAMRRTSQSKPSEMSSAKSEEKASGWKVLSTKISSGTEKADEVAASPLAQKVLRASESSTSKPDPATMDGKLVGVTVKEAEVARNSDNVDVYEFTSPSPSNKNSVEEASSGDARKTGKSRRLSSLIVEDVSSSVSETQAKGRGSRKRASMMVQKTTSAPDAEVSASVDGDSSFNSNSSGDTEVSTRGVSMRRRSTIL